MTNALIPMGAGPVTMTSREISELTGKRHDNVAPVCRSLRDSGVCPEIQETPFVSEQNGQTYTQFVLNKRDSFVLVARLSPEFTARLVDRWQELEAGAMKPAELSRLEILRLALESEQGRILAEGERDRALATKAEIGSRREATAMATASAAVREANRLRGELGRNRRHATVMAVDKVTGQEYFWRPLKKWCDERGVKGVVVPDARYGQVKAWPAEAWGQVYGVDLADLFPADGADQ